MNTSPAYLPLIGALSTAQDVGRALDAPASRNDLSAGDDRRLGPLHVGSHSQPRSIDVIEHDFVQALLEPPAR